MIDTTLSWIEIDTRERFPRYCIYKVFSNGQKLMWTTTVVYKSALRTAKQLVQKHKVPLILNTKKKGGIL